MFFMIGYKEHLLTFKASPYGDADVFQGGCTGLTVNTKAYVMFGAVDAVESVLDVWAEQERLGRRVELGELIHKTGVSLLGPVVPRADQEEITVGSPALYYYDKEANKTFQTNLDTPDVYELVSEDDEDNQLVRQLKVAILDYDKDENKQMVTNHITSYISMALNVPADAEVMYVNFKTGEIYRMSPGEFSNAR